MEGLEIRDIEETEDERKRCDGFQSVPNGNLDEKIQKEAQEHILNRVI
jgi:hypothetical protein